MLVLIGFISAVIRPAAALVTEVGPVRAAGELFGINPAVFVAGGVVILLLSRTAYRSVRWRDTAIALGMLSGLLIPSATVSWILLALMAVFLWWDGETGEAQRAAAAVLGAMALRDPFLSALIQLFGSELLALDTYLASFVLAFLDPGVRAQNNLIMGPDGVRLVILTGCSSLANLSFALLFWYAISRLYVASLGLVAWLAGMGVAIFVILLNVLRLAVMGTSPEGYRLMHADESGMVMSLVMLMVVSLVTWTGVIYGESGKNSRVVAGRAHPDRSRA